MWNGRCALLLALGCASPAAPADKHAEPRAPLVVLVTIDTLRPDHLGAYGYARDTSPNLDSLARGRERSSRRSSRKAPGPSAACRRS
ncbi:MAG: hypothetical protein M5U28_20840 [Sandaracinaceae bacterium]|nr:hypothetical protein [Sandaracinaceae bacterium]